MKYKMLVIDMDDTLLTDHIISEENKEMLLKQEKSLCYFGIRETTSDDSLCQRIKTG
jgi:hydroxymethylpyrimidine pyrophosphatase-like HAD family hydrolase